jgi:hypothetical protein
MGKAGKGVNSMIDSFLLLPLYILALSILFFGILFVARLIAKYMVLRINNFYFFKIADANRDYYKLLKAEHLRYKHILDLYFAGRIFEFLSSEKSAETKSLQMEKAVKFIKSITQNIDESNELPPITAVSAAGLMIKNNGNESDSLRTWKDNQKNNLKQLTLKYSNHFQQSLQRNKEKSITPNLSELASFARLLRLVGYTPHEVLFGESSQGKIFIEIIDGCYRRDDGKFIGFSVDQVAKLPCVCGSQFWTRIAEHLRLPPCVEKNPLKGMSIGIQLQNTSQKEYLEGCQELLRMTYNSDFGAFSACRGGIPTLIHTELALKLYLLLHFEFKNRFNLHPLEKDKLEKILRFTQNCQTNGGFCPFPGREATLHATKCALVIFEIIERIQEEQEEKRVDIAKYLDTDKSKCVNYVEALLRKQEKLALV